ncbi:hypothetical protein [Leptothoe spongobia]|uniref:Uncharacterized protein n=1 Tax=Leptothoe spongobia TAU-MAC 1115 TaxID=1967444 RepID=A0A947GGT5_9CYAN|nr:hypothetical protein [Leptothoe spongobia]MBT9314278.1 hypothetical protein [Leptothoe spongobia TAU-MAC 1115]
MVSDLIVEFVSDPMASSDTNQNLFESLHLFYLRFLGADKNWVNSVYTKFLGGAVLGSFFVLLPLLYSDIHSLGQLTYLQLGLGLLIVLTCGIFTAKLGEQFFDAVMKGFGNSGL